MTTTGWSLMEVNFSQVIFRFLIFSSRAAHPQSPANVWVGFAREKRRVETFAIILLRQERRFLNNDPFVIIKFHHLMLLINHLAAGGIFSSSDGEKYNVYRTFNNISDDIIKSKLELIKISFNLFSQVLEIKLRAFSSINQRADNFQLTAIWSSSIFRSSRFKDLEKPFVLLGSKSRISLLELVFNSSPFCSAS